jgi:uncharacterized protein (TIGR03437 family)
MRRAGLILGLAAFSAAAQTTTPPEIGSNSPSEFVRSRFAAAYYRNNFFSLCYSPPATDVIRVGTAGVAQMFQDAARTANTRLALIKANADEALRYTPDFSAIAGGDVYQVLAQMWAYTASVNNTSLTTPSALNTTGYPTMDTAACELPQGDATCLWQTFDRNYALFTYTKTLGVTTGQNFTLRDPFFTLWTNAGGMPVLGAAISAEQSVTSKISSSAGVWQQFQKGGLINITSGSAGARQVAVREPVYSIFIDRGGPAGELGFPLSEEQVLANGKKRQSFEGGTIEYGAGQDPVLLLQVKTVLIPVSGPLRLKLGESATLQVRLLDSSGLEVTGRVVNWATSNSRVASVDGAGATAVVRAAGGGVALITAVSEGAVSLPVQVFVSAPCCQAGEGAPTLAISQAIQDALTRSRLQVRIPTQAPVRRSGAGFVQEFLSLDGLTRYTVAVSESRGVGYVVSGTILSAWESLGGPPGALGYPVSDATAGGRQMFENQTALAGNPPAPVSGAILSKWGSLGYEAGVLGSPAGEPAQFLTFAASAGLAQPFQNGLILTCSAGAPAGRTIVVSGLILAAYLARGGPAGLLGFPLSDEVMIDGIRRQDFEGGVAEVAPGDVEARITEKDRRPLVTATPPVVTAGGRVRLAVGGFTPAAVISVQVDGQPDFDVSAPTGAFAWSVRVPASAAGSLVRIRAVSAGQSASGSYRIRSLREADPILIKVRGDSQLGVPGAILPQRLRVQLKDSAGSPLPGVPVRFEASPGAEVIDADGATDDSGQAEAALRLPAAEGVAVMTASAGGRVVTFAARSAAMSIQNFPKLSQQAGGTLGNGPAPVSEQGSLLASLASMIRYHQDRGELPVPNGPADAVSLNVFLKNYCSPDPAGTGVCDGFLTPPGADDQIVNIWRSSAFTGGAFTIEHSFADPFVQMRDWIAGGSPVLVALRMTADAQPAGMHFVVATGVAANTGILSFDPSGFFGRNSVNDFLSDFAVSGRVWRGSIAGVFRIALRPAAAGGFVVFSTAPVSLSRLGPECGATLGWLGRMAHPNSPPDPAPPIYIHYCDAASGTFQLDVNANLPWKLALNDMGAPAARALLDGSLPSSYRLTRELIWRLDPQIAELSPPPFAVSAASLQPDIASGTQIYINGLGLAGPGGGTEVRIDGRSARLFAVSPFRLTVEVPRDLEPGLWLLDIRSPLGELQAPIEIAAYAPAIFVDERGNGFVSNFDDRGVVNRPGQPARRGERIAVLATGLGRIEGLLPVQAVEAVLNGQPAIVDRVVPSQTVPGADLVIVRVPRSIAPGEALPLALVQGEKRTATVPVAVE